MRCKLGFTLKAMTLRALLPVRRLNKLFRQVVDCCIIVLCAVTSWTVLPAFLHAYNTAPQAAGGVTAAG